MFSRHNEMQNLFCLPALWWSQGHWWCRSKTVHTFADPRVTSVLVSYFLCWRWWEVVVVGRVLFIWQKVRTIFFFILCHDFAVDSWQKERVAQRWNIGVRSQPTPWTTTLREPMLLWNGVCLIDWPASASLEQEIFVNLRYCMRYRSIYTRYLAYKCTKGYYQQVR